jgi:hypothetical protein
MASRVPVLQDMQSPPVLSAVALRIGALHRTQGSLLIPMISSDPGGSPIYSNINAAESAVMSAGEPDLGSLQSQRRTRSNVADASMV